MVLHPLLLYCSLRPSNFAPSYHRIIWGHLSSSITCRSWPHCLVIIYGKISLSLLTSSLPFIGRPTYPSNYHHTLYPAPFINISPGTLRLGPTSAGNYHHTLRFFTQPLLFTYHQIRQPTHSTVHSTSLNNLLSFFLTGFLFYFCWLWTFVLELCFWMDLDLCFIPHWAPCGGLTLNMRPSGITYMNTITIRASACNNIVSFRLYVYNDKFSLATKDLFQHNL